MPGFLPPSMRGALAAMLLVVNTCFWCVPLFAFSLIKLVLPIKPVRIAVDRVLNAIASNWIACNSSWMRLTQRTKWDVAGLEELEYRSWYMVHCNHQSWVDIFVLQHLLNKRIPLLKFFLKRQLIYVPIIGLAWWALDFPFMRRHSSAYLRTHREKRFEDLDATRRACEKFALMPTSVMNFPEGTRFTADKHRIESSPYRYLLKPKAGALAQSLSILGNRFRWFLDVTIVYPESVPTFWQFLCGSVPKISVRARRLAIPPELRGDHFAGDPQFRKTVEHWLQDLWRDKDRQIEALLDPGQQGPNR
ncbi:MAG: acyltransferase [Betaproteobacteria bacterium]|jgi:1-acyl-sn-glycerol-3-phosphate acyltransferase